MKIDPAVLLVIVLSTIQLSAAGAYAWQRDWPRTAFWIAAVMMNVASLTMK